MHRPDCSNPRDAGSDLAGVEPTDCEQEVPCGIGHPVIKKCSTPPAGAGCPVLSPPTLIKCVEKGSCWGKSKSVSLWISPRAMAAGLLGGQALRAEVWLIGKTIPMGRTFMAGSWGNGARWGSQLPGWPPPCTPHIPGKRGSMGSLPPGWCTAPTGTPRPRRAGTCPG